MVVSASLVTCWYNHLSVGERNYMVGAGLYTMLGRLAVHGINYRFPIRIGMYEIKLTTIDGSGCCSAHGR